MFAVIGTLFNTLLVGILLWFTVGVVEMISTNLKAELTLFQAFTFSSLISAVDPVAVLSIFEEIGVNLGLYFLVFGESLLNDGVCLVLYNTMSFMASIEGSSEINASQLFIAVLILFTVVLGGLLVGGLGGVLTSVILRLSLIHI